MTDPKTPKIKLDPATDPFVTFTNGIPLWMLVAAFVIGMGVVIIAIGLLPSKEGDTDATG